MPVRSVSVASAFICHVLYSQKSILEYLHANNFTDAYNALKEETGVEYTPDAKSWYGGLLEKKWTSVIRLQKKVRLSPYC